MEDPNATCKAQVSITEPTKAIHPDESSLKKQEGKTLLGKKSLAETMELMQPDLNEEKLKGLEEPLEPNTNEPMIRLTNVNEDSNKNWEINDAKALDDPREKDSGKKKRERRQKVDNYQRNYICGCSKSYLSYAALYTHAKTKHDGIFPEGTTTLHKKKQGRPKKDEWAPAKVNAEYQKTYDFNKDFRHFLEMIPGAKKQKEFSDKGILEFFPVDMFEKREDYINLYSKLEQIRKDLLDNYGKNFLEGIDMSIFEINNAKSLNCTEILSLFLIYVFRFVSKSFYKELVFFIVSYRLMMNQKGWEKIQDMVNSEDAKRSEQQFCDNHNAEFAPDFANFYILDFFSDLIQSKRLLKQPHSLHFFGLESIKLLRIILLIKHFCLWLYNYKFTKAKIDIFKE